MPADNKPYFAKIDASASGDTTIVAGKAGRSIRVINYTIIAQGDVSLTWKSGSTAISGPMKYTDAGGACPPGNGSHLLDTADGEDLVLNLDAAIQVGGHLAYEFVDDE